MVYQNNTQSCYGTNVQHTAWILDWALNITCNYASVFVQNLRKACSNKDIESVQQFIAAKVDVNSQDQVHACTH